MVNKVNRGDEFDYYLVFHFVVDCSWRDRGRYKLYQSVGYTFSSENKNQRFDFIL